MNEPLKHLILAGGDGNVGPNFPLPVRSPSPRKRPLLKFSIVQWGEKAFAFFFFQSTVKATERAKTEDDQTMYSGFVILNSSVEIHSGFPVSLQG